MKSRFAKVCGCGWVGGCVCVSGCVDGLFSAPEQKGAVMNYSLDAKAEPIQACLRHL